MRSLHSRALIGLLSGGFAATLAAWTPMGQGVATPAGVIVVTVRDATTSAAIARATVKIAPRGYGTSTSGRVDRQGQVGFVVILPDTYPISVSAPGYELRAVPKRADSILPDARPDRQRITVSAGSRTQVDFVLKRGGRLTSMVTAASGGPANAIPIELFAAGQASAGHALPFLGLWRVGSSPTMVIRS
jgi:hypothetical protein